MTEPAITRRKFVAAGLGAAGILATSQTALARQLAKKSRPGPLPVTYALAGNFT